MPGDQRFFALCRDDLQHQLYGLGRCFVAREVAAAAHCFAHVTVQALDRVGGVDDAADLRHKGEELDHLRPVTSLTAMAGYFWPRRRRESVPISRGPSMLWALPPD